MESPLYRIETTQPLWIEPVDLDELMRTYDADGHHTHQILNDYQVSFLDGDQHTYYSIARMLSDIDDVEYYSNLTFTFDPAYERIVLHAIRILRDGTWIDKLPDATITLLQREQDLERLVIDGRQTLSIVLSDVRSGDRFVYAFSQIGRHPTHGEHFGDVIYIDRRAEVYRSHIQIAVDPKDDARMQLRYFNHDTPFERRVLPDRIGYFFWGEQLPAVETHDKVPPWYNPWRHVVVSSVQTWSEVIAWAAQIYHEGIFKVEEPLPALIEEIRAHSDVTEERIVYAIRFVQEQIRYFADSTGLGGIVPVAPTLSLRQRFADCKNKVVLLKTLLDALGVESYPVLVSSRDQDEVATHGPSLLAFDHMILQVIHAGQAYWIDATFTGQAGDLGHWSQPDYGYALRIHPDDTDLIPMHPAHPRGTIRARQVFDLSRPEGTLEVVTTYSDFHADRMRRRTAGAKIRQLEEDYLHHYDRRYPGITLRRPFMIEDDTRANTLTLTEQYQLPDIWEYDAREQEYRVVFHNDEIGSAHSVPDKSDRNVPWQMVYPSDVVEERTIVLPYPFDEKLTTLSERNDWFEFVKDETLSSDRVRLHQTYTYRAHKRHVPPEEILDYIKHADEGIYTTYTLWHPDPYDRFGARSAAQMSPDKQPVGIYVEEHYDLRAPEATCTITTRYEAYEAHWMRRRLEKVTPQELQEEYQTYYRRYFSEATASKPLRIDDHPDKNHLIIEETYTLGRIWNQYPEAKGYRLAIPNEAIVSSLVWPDDEHKNEPLQQRYPRRIELKRTVLFPEPYEEFHFPKHINNDFFVYSKREEAFEDDTRIEQHYTLQILTEHITPEQIVDYSKACEKIESTYSIWQRENPYSNSWGKRFRKFAFEAVIYGVIFFLLRWIVDLF